VGAALRADRVDSPLAGGRVMTDERGQTEATPDYRELRAKLTEAAKR
jgi:hypothetical protein